jgi:choline dehydrogenase-like flavoprotein
MKGRATRRGFVLAAATAIALPAAPAAWRFLRSSPRVDNEIPEYHGPSATLGDLRESAPFDVCVVGSGPAGTLLGIQLARAGLRTVIVEAGVNPAELAREPRYAELGSGTVSGDLMYPLVASRILMPGGTTAIWTGNTPRLLPIDFERHAYTLPDAGWPVTYAQLEPYYCRAERALGVAGDPEAPFAAPRSCGLPYEKQPEGDGPLEQVLARAGVQGATTFRSTSLHGGPVRVARDLLPVFARQPGAVFAPGVVARRFVPGADGAIASVRLEAFGEPAFDLPSRVFVLAGGGVETARRLLLSASERFPNGIGNHADLVGRTFTEHPTLQFRARVPYKGPKRTQTLRCFQFYEAFKRRGLGGAYLAMTLRPTDAPGTAQLEVNVDCELWQSPDNRVTLDPALRDPFGDPAAHLHLGASDRDHATFAAARELARGICARAGAKQVEEEPHKWSYHHLGTVRMGDDARTSVCDADLRVHGTRNLHVLTSGAFSTPGVSNPTLLIGALAFRLAGTLASA